jgi:uncharacterized membrane protein YedE/YeeE
VETSFTPWTGLLGGALIGLASAGLLLANGKVAGISGILGQGFFASAGDLGWRVSFLVGLPLGAWIAARASSSELDYAMTSDPMLLVAGGLLVGIGTQLGGGCTSGHAVCGMARGSRRAIVATLIFMLAGGVTVFVARHLLGGVV